jgi:hypothetical protein
MATPAVGLAAVGGGPAGDGAAGVVGTGVAGVTAAAVGGLAGLELTAVPSEPPPPQAGMKSTFIKRISERLDGFDFMGMAQ